MHTGSCLCGAVTYTLDAAIEAISCCHCRECRKASGSAFLAVAAVPAAALQLHGDTTGLRAHRATPGKRRVFCGHCGSPIYSVRDERADVLRLRIGTLDTPLGAVPRVHAFCADRADWDEINDDHPRYPGFAG